MTGGSLTLSKGYEGGMMAGYDGTCDDELCSPAALSSVWQVAVLLTRCDVARCAGMHLSAICVDFPGRADGLSAKVVVGCFLLHSSC